LNIIILHVIVMNKYIRILLLQYAFNNIIITISHQNNILHQYNTSSLLVHIYFNSQNTSRILIHNTLISQYWISLVILEYYWLHNTSYRTMEYFSSSHNNILHFSQYTMLSFNSSHQSSSVRSGILNCTAFTILSIRQ